MSGVQGTASEKLAMVRTFNKLEERLARLNSLRGEAIALDLVAARADAEAAIAQTNADIRALMG